MCLWCLNSSLVMHSVTTLFSSVKPKVPRRGYAKHNSSHPQITSVLLAVLQVAPGSPLPKSWFFFSPCQKLWELSTGARGPRRRRSCCSTEQTFRRVLCARSPCVRNPVLSRFSGRAKAKLHWLPTSVEQKIRPAQQGIDTLDCEMSAAASGPLRNYSRCLGKKTGAPYKQIQIRLRIFDWDSYTAGRRLPLVLCLQQLR